MLQKLLSQKLVSMIVILVVVLCGGIYAFKQIMPADAKDAQGPVYATKEVIRGDITVGVNTTGMLNPTRGGGIRVPGDYRSDMVSVQYVIEEILVEEGDSVVKDQVLVKLNSPDLEAKIEEARTRLEAKEEELSEMTGVPVSQLSSINPAKGITLRAPVDGKVSRLDVVEGEEIPLGHIVARIVDDSRYIIRAKLTPAEFKMVSKGQTVTLSFPYFEGFAEGKITDVNPNPIPDMDKDGVPRGYVHIIEIEGENPGLVQPLMDVHIILDRGDGSTLTVSNTARVEKFITEERVINRAESFATEVYVHEMESVKKGDPIVSMTGTDVQKTLENLLEEIMELRLDLKQLESTLDQTEIRATMDGVVASIHRQEGESVRVGEWIGDIYNTGEMMVWAQVDDIDIVNVKQDAPVKVTVDAVPGETFEGKVTHVSPMGEKINNVTRFSINIEVKGGPQLRPGMQANCFIDGGSAENVLLIPVEAIFEEDGKTMVEVLDEDGNVKMVQVRLGLMNDRYAEVIDGLEEGQLVITGSSADLLPSQQIKAKDTLLPEKSEDNNNNN
ncbi:MAG TPA: efflux RND transporter periplasmic adaptor subunit [Clostridia bacterium]|nr:efflux RND transporter periplasmic adaptor subunit [Clostridia bacterium]